MKEIDDDIAAEEFEQHQLHLHNELMFLFGKDTVEQAEIIDVVDIKLNNDMTQCISRGVTRLKQLKDMPDAQQKYIQELNPAEKILVCMWIMEMNLLEKLQSKSYIER